MTIVEFLTARLNEAEAEWHCHRKRKRKDIFALPCPNCGNRISSQSVGGLADDGVMLYHERSADCFLPLAAWREFADDGPAGDPRDLADIAAKRAVIEWCSERDQIWVGTIGSNPDLPKSSDFVPGYPTNPGGAVVLRHLASVYSDHPGYNPEWKP